MSRMPGLGKRQAAERDELAAQTVRARAVAIPLLACAIIAMLGALWGGLLRIGWPWPVVAPSLARDHGPLLIGGFLGTLISLERAIALRATWSFAAPLCSAAGALLLLAGLPAWAGALLLTLGSGGLVVIAAALLRRQAALFHGLLVLGAALWLGGNLRWLGGATIPQVVPWWQGFLVVTIVAERLELSRLIRTSRWQRASYLAAIGALLAGVATTVVAPDAGARLFGLGLLGLALWLWRYDIARRTVRKAGLTRFIAVALLTGYAWLGIGGILALAFGSVSGGTHYDAFVHALLVGFVIGMIFAHAPIIFPAILRVSIAYSPALYLPVILLQLSLALRLLGDLLTLATLRQVGGLLNAVTLLAFLGNTLRLALRGGRAGARPRDKNAPHPERELGPA
ncbi:MAG: hypothetical protein U0232_28705 [Thermomicrobiales bacterium]